MQAGNFTEINKKCMMQKGMQDGFFSKIKDCAALLFDRLEYVPLVLFEVVYGYPLSQ